MAELFLNLASIVLKVASYAADLVSVELHVELSEQALDQASDMARKPRRKSELDWQTKGQDVTVGSGVPARKISGQDSVEIIQEDEGTDPLPYPSTVVVRRESASSTESGSYVRKGSTALAAVAEHAE
nr:hypothetical protein L203_02071 [Cryptococcus depauperatus CBS 7841]